MEQQNKYRVTVSTRAAQMLVSHAAFLAQVSPAAAERLTVEFEKAAKNAVIKVLNENINISELDLVWFAHELGYKKCTIWGQPMGDRYAEVTYNRAKDEIYVDIYKKISNTKIQREEFDMEAW